MAKYLVQYFKQINRFKFFRIYKNYNKFEESFKTINEYFYNNSDFFSVILNYIYFYDSMQCFNYWNWIDESLSRNMFPEKNTIFYRTPENMVNWDLEVGRSFTNFLLSSRSYVSSLTKKKTKDGQKFNDLFNDIEENEFAFFLFRLLRNGFSHIKRPELDVRSMHGNVTSSRKFKSKFELVISTEEFFRQNKGAIKKKKYEQKDFDSEIDILFYCDRYFDLLIDINKKDNESKNKSFDWSKIKEATKLLSSKKIDEKCSSVFLADIDENTPYEVHRSLTIDDYNILDIITSDSLKMCRLLVQDLNNRRLFEPDITNSHIL